MKRARIFSSQALKLSVVFALLSSFYFGAQPLRAEHWDLNDVSILFPLPKRLDERLDGDLLLRPGSQGAGGPLLPSKDLDLIPALTHSGDTAKSSLAVVGLRIDPCFPASLSLSLTRSIDPCRRQLRLIWQPLVVVDGEISTLDAAVHSFYDLSQLEFEDLLKALLKLRASSRVSTQGLALQVHPALVAQGLEGPYGQQLRKLVMRFAGEKRLSRVTFMTLEAHNQMWDFGGFDIDGEKTTRIAIARVGTRLQSFVNRSQSSDEFLGGAKPQAPDDHDTFNRILTRSLDIANIDAVLHADLDAIYRIENPRVFSPEQIDCVSCHAAQTARDWSFSKFPELFEAPNEFAFRSSDWNLTNSTGDSRTTRMLRAFGYQGAKPSINQRVVNESAAVCESLSRH
jgi:hypothetical protein